MKLGTHLDSCKMCSETTGKESICTKWRDAHKAAQVDKVNPLQVVQSQLIVKQLCKACDLKIVY